MEITMSLHSDLAFRYLQCMASFYFRKCPLIMIGRGSKIAPKMGRYRVGRGRQVKNGQKPWDVINVRSLSENHPILLQMHMWFHDLLSQKILNGIYCACATCPRRQRPFLRNVLYMMRRITSKKFTLISFILFLTFLFKTIMIEGDCQNLRLINDCFLSLSIYFLQT